MPEKEDDFEDLARKSLNKAFKLATEGVQYTKTDTGKIQAADVLVRLATEARLQTAPVHPIPETVIPNDYTLTVKLIETDA